MWKSARGIGKTANRMWKCLAVISCSATRKCNPADQLRRFDVANFSVVNDGTKSINNNWTILFFNRFISNHGLIRMLNQSPGYAWRVAGHMETFELFFGIDSLNGQHDFSVCKCISYNEKATYLFLKTKNIHS